MRKPQRTRASRARELLPVLGMMALAGAIGACGGPEQPMAPAERSAQVSPPAVTPLAPLSAQAAQSGAPSGSIEATVVSSDLAVGTNRFVVGLFDRAKGALVIDARLHLRVFLVDEQSGSAMLKAERDPAPLTLERSFTHRHKDGVLETHGAGTIGVYVTTLEFDKPGKWGVEITGTAGGHSLPAMASGFLVAERPRAIGVGESAPRSVQAVLADVKDISDIDTSNPPDPHMHQMTIADAVSSGKPTVIVFSTPGFCTSRTCGPAKTVVDELYARYSGKANFIHVEPYDLEKARSGQGLHLVPVAVEWRLPSEPWAFIVDANGRVAARYEGIFGFAEVEACFLEALASP